MSVVSNYLYLLLLFLLVDLTLQGVALVHPPDLVQRFTSNVLTASYGNFGRIYSGFSTRGRIYMVKQESQQENYACKPLTDLYISITPGIWEYFPIILIERGNCSYVEMARNVQRAGGYMALIINNKEGNVKDYPVKDDGTASDIVIPTAMISKEDGDKIKNYYNERYGQENIILQLSFYTHRQEVVDIEFYTEINNQKGFQLMDEFSSYYNLIKDISNFKPYYVSYQLGTLSKEDKANLCVSNGKYCLTGSLPFTDEVTGKQLLIDSVFHQCVHSLTNTKENNHTEYYLDFASYYLNNCLYVDEYKKYCGREQISRYGLDASQVDKCIAASFGKEGKFKDADANNDNSILKDNLDKIREQQITIFPTVVVNGKKLKGRLTAENLFLSVCSSFNKVPQPCMDYFWHPSSANKGLSVFQIFLIVIVVIAVNVGVIFLCRKYIQKRISDRVTSSDLDIDGRINSVVSSYFALKERGVHSNTTALQ